MCAHRRLHRQDLPANHSKHIPPHHHHPSYLISVQRVCAITTQAACCWHLLGAVAGDTELRAPAVLHSIAAYAHAKVMPTFCMAIEEEAGTQYSLPSHASGVRPACMLLTPCPRACKTPPPARHQIQPPSRQVLPRQYTPSAGHCSIPSATHRYNSQCDHTNTQAIQLTQQTRPSLPLCGDEDQSNSPHEHTTHITLTPYP